MKPSEEQPTFESVKTRLAEIADAIGDEALSLDDALDLYEEAVALGLQASDLLETGVTGDEDDLEEPDAPDGQDTVAADQGMSGAIADNAGAPASPANESAIEQA